MEESLLAEVERTKGGASTSERVNELVARALELERRDELEREAALFYSRRVTGAKSALFRRPRGV